MNDLLFIGAVLLIVALIGFGYVGYWFIRHEKSQKQQIAELNARVSLLSANEYETVEWYEEGFNYLAIGNSLTLHTECSYWWNEVGMAASDAEHDYYHLVVDYLKQKNENVTSYAYNFSVWETQSTDRDETLEFIKFLLSDKIDLVTIQLGENASNLDTFEIDYESLVSYILKYAPRAEIIVVGDFWSSGERDNYKHQAADNCNVNYILLDGIKDNKDYQCGLNSVVYDANGNEHIVEHIGVASHPGDTGMQAIADFIIAEIKRVYNY